MRFLFVRFPELIILEVPVQLTVNILNIGCLSYLLDSGVLSIFVVKPLFFGFI